MSAPPNNDIALKVDQSTIDLLNAAISSTSQLPQLQALNDKENNSSTGTSKRSIDTTDESDVTPSAVAPKRAGRKPLAKSTASDNPLDPKQKRKAQNRAAQRAFRERKEKHVSELQDRIKELEELASKADVDLIKENEQLKERLKQLQEENYALKDAKFTFEFPVTDHPHHQQQQQQQQQPQQHQQQKSSSLSPNSTNDIQEETSSSGSSTEQSPISTAHEDDYSDSPSTKTPTLLQDPSASFLPFGSFGGNPHIFDGFLAIPGNDSGGEIKSQQNNDSLTSGAYDMKDLFHGKEDLFTGYRAPPPTTSLLMTGGGTDEFNTDDFLLDSNNNNNINDNTVTGILPDLFDGSGDLFGFTQQQQDQHAPFLLDQFYMPDEQQPHVRKETVASSLHRAKQDGVRAYEVHQQLKNVSDFNLDALCADLKKKASCCDSKYVLSEYDVGAYLACFDQK